MGRSALTFCAHIPSPTLRLNLTRLLLMSALLVAGSKSLAQADPRSSTSRTAEIEVSTDTILAPGQGAEPPDPCAMDKDEELLGLDWSRRQLHHGLCASVRWFDGFFGEQRFDEAARKIRGRVSYAFEHRDRVGLDGKLRLRLRVATPNLNKRLNFFVERENERNTALGRTDGDVLTDTAQPAASQSDALRAGFGYNGIKNDHEALEFRTSLRIRDGQLAPFARARYWREFLRTDISQWRFTETLSWQMFDGWGETTSLDYEYKINDPTLARWFNNATWSESTLGLSWGTGIALYRNIGTGRAAVVELRVEGQSDAAVKVGNYGGRLTYRQTLGRKWLLGAVYSGCDWPKSLPGDVRHSQLYGGAGIEVLFGHH